MLTQLCSHCYTPTCFSPQGGHPQGVLIDFVNIVNKMSVRL